MERAFPWAQKWLLWASEKDIFHFFETFWVTKLKPFSGKVSQSVQNYLNQNLVIGSFLEYRFEDTWAQKRRLWTFEKDIFQFFTNFWMTKLNWYSRKAMKNVQNSLNQNLAIARFLEKPFKANLSSKANAFGVWKGHFSFFFFKFLSEEVETVFWESETILQNFLHKVCFVRNIL